MPIDLQNDTLQIALQKLKAKENTLRRLEAISKLGSWEVDLITKKSTWSDMSYRIYGYEPSEIEPSLDTFFSHLLPEYIEPAKKLLEHMIKTNEIGSFHAKLRRKDGKVIDLLLNAQVISDENSTPIKLIGTTQDITEYVNLKKESQELLDIIEKSSSEIYILDMEHFKYVYANEGGCKKLGYTKEEMYQKDVYDINPTLTKEEALYIKEKLKKDGYFINKSIHKKKDGSLYYVQAYIQPIQYHDMDCFIIFDTDITSLVELEKKQKEQAKIVNSIDVGVISTDLKGNVQNCNTAARRILNLKDKISSISDIYNCKENELYFREILESIQNCQTKCSKNLEVYFRKNKTDKVICSLSLTQLKDENGEVYGIIWLFQDISEKKYKEKLLKEQAFKLAHQANHDALTGLPNRTLFRDRLEETIKYSKRNNKKFALMFIDLDRFKQINDSFGHQFGDKFLLEVTTRLKKILREEDTLARLGGDEFTIIAKDIHSKEDCKVIAEKILDILKEPIYIDNNQIYASLSIGISLYPDDSNNTSNLIKYADSAMYRAKEKGRNNYKFYSFELTMKAFENVVMETKLRSAIKNEEFEVYYQPQVVASADKLIGVEALVRWNHPELGLVSPAKFIPIAEDSGLIVDIDRIVMKKALKDYNKAKEMGCSFKKLSLNLATKQLLRDDFISYIETTLQNNNFNPKNLGLEVIESDIMRDPYSSIKILEKINDLGIDISVDDFGTGYSSLAYLKKLPINKLKIDRSFVMDIINDEDSAQIVNAIIVLAKSLNLDIIAEGVETKEQCDFLLQMGCKNIQGYYFSKPLCFEDMIQYCKKSELK